MPFNFDLMGPDEMEVLEKVLEAIDTVSRGVCKRIDVNDRIKVYQVKNVIRIDIKEEK